jgi:uncharacterized protein
MSIRPGDPLLERIVVWAHRRAHLVFVVAAVFVLVSLAGISRLRFDPDVLRLLPANGAAVPAFRTYLQRFGTLDDLYVVFSAPEGHTIDEYDDEIDAWIEALRAAPELSRVDSGQIDDSRDWSWLSARELLLLDDVNLREALRRLTPDGMHAALAASRDLLVVPSPEVAALVREDPLGLHDLLRRQVGGTQTAFGLGISERGYVTSDGRRRLLIARPRKPPYDTAFSHALFDRLHSISRKPTSATADAGDARPPLDVQLAGGHRIALEAEAVVKRESIVNGVGSLALILPLLFVVFRSFRLVLIGAVPSALSFLVVLGTLGFAGTTLSAAATGASAMLFGLGVDGVVLLYVAHLFARETTADPEDAIRAVGAPAESMLLGMWTTAATFLGLVVIDFPSLEQLGLLIGTSMLVCGVATLVLVPAALDRRPGRRPARSLQMFGAARIIRHYRWPIIATSILATMVLGFFSTQLRVNPTLDRLRSVTEGARYLQKVTETFGLPADVIVILQQGGALEPLLEANTRVTSALINEMPGTAIEAPTTLLPPNRVQSERAALIRESLPSSEALLSTLERAGVAAGFRAGALAPFAARLSKLTDTGNVLTWDSFAAHGLEDIVSRFIVHDTGGWIIATYVFPRSSEEIVKLQGVLAKVGVAATLTGMPLVNAELSANFLPQFLKGVGIGSAVVLALILASFRNWRHVLLALAPTAIGLIWAGGILALARVELDLFALFAVMTFVGIGVDYGVHLIHRYKDLGDPVRVTAELGPVILIAGAITLLGYGTLTTSSYPPLQSIGTVSVVSVLTLVAASVLVLPALLPDRQV